MSDQDVLGDQESLDGQEVAREQEVHGDQEFLVFVEEDEDGFEEDRLVLDVGRRAPPRLPELVVRPEIEVDLVNRSSRIATVGLASGVFGALVGLAALVAFAVTFPQEWFTPQGALRRDAAVMWFTTLFAVVGGAALVVGAVLTYYGRRLAAEGRIRELHVMQRTPLEADRL